MYNEKTVAVVVKAFNEEKQIRMVLDRMPDFVDRVIVVNDGSTDDTAGVVAKYIENQPKSSIAIEKTDDEIGKSPYDSALIVLKEMRKKEESLYSRSEIWNNNATDRVVLINQENGGAGSAVATGYKWCREHNIQCAVVVDGDGQMDPSEMESLVAPVVSSGVDYVKGNRLIQSMSNYLCNLSNYRGILSPYIMAN